jgi:hypothetical protein
MGIENLDRTSVGLVGVQHLSEYGWMEQPEWLSGLLRIAETVAEALDDVRRRAVIITPHASQVVALIAAHLALRRFRSRSMPERWWDHEPRPVAAVRHLTSGSELLLLREIVRSPGGEVALRFEAPYSALMSVPSGMAGRIVPIPLEELSEGVVPTYIDPDTWRFADVVDFLGRDGVLYALSRHAPVTVVGRKDETRAQLEGNWVRNAEGGSASLAAIARVKEFARATSFRSRWLSADHATSGRAEPGSLLILSGGTTVTAAVHELDEHPWIAVLDRSSPSLAGAVAQIEQYYFSVETRRLEAPDDVVLAKGHEVLIFEEPA